MREPVVPPILFRWRDCGGEVHGAEFRDGGGQGISRGMRGEVHMIHDHGPVQDRGEAFEVGAEVGSLRVSGVVLDRVPVWWFVD